MSCEVELRLSGDSQEIVANAPVSGVVVVRSDRALTTPGISVALGWRTVRNRFASDGREIEEFRAGLVVERRIVVFAGTVAAGESSHPFELVAPPGPLTHAGTALSVLWELTAVVEISRAMDPAHTLPIRLVGGSLPNAIVLGPVSPEATKHFVSSGDQKTAGWVGTVGILGMALLFAWLGQTQVAVFHVFTVACVLGGAAFFWHLLLRDALAARGLGPVTFLVPENPVHAGDSLPLTVRFTPSDRIELRGASATLVCDEGVPYRKGGLHHELSRHEVPLAGRQVLSPGEPVEWRGTIALPRDAATTFGDGQSEVVWVLRLRIERGRWVHWTEERLVIVLPPGCFRASV